MIRIDTMEEVIGQQVYQVTAAKIYDLIQAENLRPGDKLPSERELSERLEVSRGVIRDAIKVLTTTGTVMARQGSGLYVTNKPQPSASATIDLSMPLDFAHIVGLFEFRIALETQIAKLAAERITLKQVRALKDAMKLCLAGAKAVDHKRFTDGDDNFHRIIAEATGDPSPFFVSAITTTRRLQNWAVHFALAGTPGSLRTAADEHLTIFNAIQNSDPEDAARTMEAHLRMTMASYQDVLRRRLVDGREEPAR